MRNNLWKLLIVNLGFITGIYLSKINNGKTRTVCEVSSELIIKTPERCHRLHSCVFVFNFEQVSHIVLAFPMFPWNK